MNVKKEIIDSANNLQDIIDETRRSIVDANMGKNYII